MREAHTVMRSHTWSMSTAGAGPGRPGPARAAGRGGGEAAALVRVGDSLPAGGRCLLAPTAARAASSRRRPRPRRRRGVRCATLNPGPVTRRRGKIESLAA